VILDGERILSGIPHENNLKMLPEMNSAERRHLEASGDMNAGDFVEQTASPGSNPEPTLNRLGGSGEMRARIRSFDWARHPLGSPESWPQSLRTVIRIMLDSRYAMWMGWGPGLAFFYNDAYARDTLGKKHPWALGQPAREVWAEIWSDLSPRIERVLSTGDATWDEGLRLLLERSGYLEETFHTFSYSPLYDDTGEMGGMLCVVTEETKRILSERRLALLRELAANTTARTVDEACERFEQTLEQNSADIPFALIYLLAEDSREASLKGSVKISANQPETISLDDNSKTVWPIAKALAVKKTLVVSNLEQRFGKLPDGEWPTQSAVVLPIPGADAEHPLGALVLGVNPRRALDDDYEGFFQLVAGQFATSVSNAQSYEKERQRAEALAELDRAKTAFFSNVSHEFRTPLTLMLGPLEEMLKDGSLPAEEHAQLEIIHRNGLRLLKLVNSLLDFSRIEAGRLQANFEPVDLATFTMDLASAFRSVMEKAGLQFHVECSPLPGNVFVDRDMWEKIILNLLSNAFKFTFNGRVTVSLCTEAGDAVLRVADTGTGIPDEELANVFKRFHRVQGARGRTHEGTGIGLALVHDLVKLHDGSIAIESKAGKGSTFTVRIPLGKHHLPAEPNSPREGSTALRGDVFVQEALRWMPGKSGDPTSDTRKTPTAAVCARILVADDNSDMRDYVGRMLRGRYDVVAAADGEQALKAARKKKPDLILSDVMMPKMDGFEFLKAVRSDTNLKTVPVILLSARAGDEARVEGIEHGADDYLIKPFTGRELLARVETHIKLARFRSEVEDALRKAHEELIQMNRDLERRVHDRTASLQEAIAQMEEFSYSVSHDLRAPVRAMHGYARAVLEDYEDKLDERGKEYLERILQSGSRMDRLINDVLTYTRVSRRETPLARVSLDRLVRDILSQHPALAQDRARVCVPSELPDVVGHEPSLSQVVSNLLDNAVKFVAPGVKPEVVIHCQRDNGNVRLWIDDNGIGIRPEHQTRLFGMFERLHSEGKYEGTGIGLAIVRKATERMGGKVGIVSDGNNGSHFWIELPAAA
jgi:signal transduction histidine kinase